MLGLRKHYHRFVLLYGGHFIIICDHILQRHAYPMSPTTAAAGNVMYGAYVRANCINRGHITQKLILKDIMYSAGADLLEKHKKTCNAN